MQLQIREIRQKADAMERQVTGCKNAVADLKSVVATLHNDVPHMVHRKVCERVVKVVEESVAKKVVAAVERSETITKVQEDMGALRRITTIYREAIMKGQRREMGKTLTIFGARCMAQ